MQSGVDGHRIMEWELCQALVEAGKLDADGLDRAFRGYVHSVKMGSFASMPCCRCQVMHDSVSRLR